MRPAYLRAVSFAVVLAWALAACDNKPPTTPTPPPGGGGTPPAPTPVLIRLEVDGPGTVAPGETAQFTATGHYSDGSTRNVTNEPGTIWRSNLTRVLTISAAGLATGGERGEASVTAMFSGRGSTKPGVIVVPAGTYRLLGTVTDTGIPVSGARVEVTHGPATGMVATASPTYRLYGVSGDTEIRVTKDGYRDEGRRIQMTSHQTADFALTPTRPRENVEGTYTLTVTAADECSQLPQEARLRTYSAVLTQQGPQVTATLQGSTFLTVGSRPFNRFTGTLEADRLTFFLLDPFYYYGYFYSGDVIEQLTTSTYVYLSGTAALSASSGGRSGALDGVVGTMEGPPRFRLIASCRSASHRFVLTR